MLDNWQLTSNAHVVIRDSGKYGTRVGGGWHSKHGLFCTLYTVVRSATDDLQERWHEMCCSAAGAVQIAGWPLLAFRVGQGKYRRLQELMQGIPHHLKLIQDVATRWNSTYYMDDCITEQEEVITSYKQHYRGQLPVAVPSSFRFSTTVVDTNVQCYLLIRRL